MPADTTTWEQRAYFHTLRFLIAEAERPADSTVMGEELRRLYREARCRAKLQRLPWDEWQDEQERILIELMDHQCIVVPDDVLMALDH